MKKMESSDETFRGIKSGSSRAEQIIKFKLNDKAFDEENQSNMNSENQNELEVIKKNSCPSPAKPKISSDEIKRELRHKYLVILKSCYWQFFEEG